MFHLTPMCNEYSWYFEQSRKTEEEYIRWRTMNPNDIEITRRDFVPMEREFFIVTDRLELRVADGIHQYADCPVYCSGLDYEKLYMMYKKANSRIDVMDQDMRTMIKLVDVEGKLIDQVAELKSKEIVDRIIILILGILTIIGCIRW